MPAALLLSALCLCILVSQPLEFLTSLNLDLNRVYIKDDALYYIDTREELIDLKAILVIF
jgi:hypothetical protein